MRAWPPKDAQPGAPGQPPPLPDDPMLLLQQLLGGNAAGGTGGMSELFGGAAAPGAAGAGGGAPSLFGGGGKSTDALITDRLPVLQQLRRPILVAFFIFCFYKGWVGRWGLVQGSMSKSYFDMLAVPLRTHRRSPWVGKSFVVAQFWVDASIRLSGFLLKLARGKAKIPTLQDFVPMPLAGGGLGGLGGGAGGLGGGFGGGASGLGGGGLADLQNSPLWAALSGMGNGELPNFGGMPPTAGTRTWQGPPQPPGPHDVGPARPSSPPVIDAEVTFLD